jgi:hypothetical protein
LQQGRLTDAGITAQKHNSPWNQAATEHPIEFANGSSSSRWVLAPDRDTEAGAEKVVSESVFHLRQSGHCPAHLTLCAPHSVQT